jgi:hypothetical protein
MRAARRLGRRFGEQEIVGSRCVHATALAVDSGTDKLIGSVCAASPDQRAEFRRR